MSHKQKVIAKRVVEESVELLVCDECGAESMNRDRFGILASPLDWYLVVDPERRVPPGQYMDPRHFCSAKCLEIFAFAEVGKAKS